MFAYLLIAVLLFLLIVSLPVWPYSRRWGYYGTTGIAILLMLVALLMEQYVI